jgi:hypothetical protein
MLSEAAEKFGVRLATISDIVRVKGIVTKSMGIPGKCRGLDTEAMQVLADVFSPVPAKKKAVRAAELSGAAT